MNSALQLALDHGWRLLPCRPGSKLPATAHGVKDATRDPAQIREWAREHPNANWAAAMGNGVLALDVDVKDGGHGEVSLATLEDRHSPLPPTLTNQTWSGGRQLIFGHDPAQSFKNSAGKLARNLDVRSDDGYIVIAPSRIKGRAYAWADPHAEIAPAPAWLLDELQKLNNDRAPLSREATEGGRNVALTRHLGALRAKGLSDEELLREALRFNESSCVPPLDVREVQNVLRSAFGWRRIYAASDLGNARRFLDQHGPDAHYIRETREWVEWNAQEHRWVRSPEGLGLIARIKGTLTQALGTEVPERPTPQEQQAHARWLIGSTNTRRLEAALANAKSEPRVALDRAALDAQPQLVGCRNGVLNLRTGDHRPGQREDLLTLRLGCDYMPGATAPRFQQFLADQVSADMADYLRRLAGLTLLGNRLRLLLFVYGPSKSGKSVFIETLKALLGDYGRAASSDLLMARSMRSRNGPTEALARLAGAKLVTVNETGAHDAFDEALIKDLTGGDTVSARELYRGSFDFRPDFVIWIRGNHKPRFSGSDVAMLERIRLVPFVRRRAEHERDPGLLEHIISHELPGVLNWALAGAADVQRDGRIATPDEVATATADYAREMDMLGQWLDDACDLRPAAQCFAAQGYARFVEWSRSQGLAHPWTRIAWGRAMGERFERKRVGDSWVYLGVEVRHDPM